MLDTRGIIRATNECSAGAGNTPERGQSVKEIDMRSVSSVSPAVKVCHICGNPKKLSDFRTRNDIHSGVNAVCKACEKARRFELAQIMAAQPITDRDREKFWVNVDRSGDCWEWQGRKTDKGYGRHFFRYRTVTASRFAYQLTYGTIPTGLGVLHRCDNPPCVRPDHLFLGTPKDNAQDMVQKGRHWVWNKPDVLANRNHSRVKRKGESNGNARLTASAVQSIRERFATGGITKVSLAREFGVGASTIFDIVTGRRWQD